MQTTAGINRFLIESFSFSKRVDSKGAIIPGEFYKQVSSEIIKGVTRIQTLIDLADSIIALADNAYAFRRIDIIEQASRVLMNLSLPYHYKSIGQYYQALVIKRRGEFDEARAILERVAEEAPLRYRARAMLTIGAAYFDNADYHSALPLYLEANRAAAHNDWCDPLTTVISRRMIAVLRSVDGDHRGALNDLRSMLPLSRMVGSVYPFDYYNHLNSLAVELIEADQLEEAKKACRIALASPYASAYPEYRETWDDIQTRGYRASRSIVACTQRALNAETVLRLPSLERGDSSRQADLALNTRRQSARVLDYAEWKNKMTKEPNQTLQNEKRFKILLDEKEKIVRIIQLVSQPDRTAQELGDILEAVEKIVAKPKGKGK